MEALNPFVYLSVCQVSLQQSPKLSALEQEVMRRLLQVREEAERLRAGLNRYSYLWQSNRRRVMQEFLTYSRQLGPEELEAEKIPPTLKDFQREVRHTCPGVLLQTLQVKSTCITPGLADFAVSSPGGCDVVSD